MIAHRVDAIDEAEDPGQRQGNRQNGSYSDENRLECQREEEEDDDNSRSDDVWHGAPDATNRNRMQKLFNIPARFGNELEQHLPSQDVMEGHGAARNVQSMPGCNLLRL